MNKNIYILKDKKIAFEMDEKRKVIYFYYAYKSELQQDTKSILKTINSELAQVTTEYFNVDIQEYGVSIDDSPVREFSDDDKNDIYKDRFLKYLVIFFILVSLYMIGFEDIIQERTKPFAYIGLFVATLVLLLLTGREQFKRDETETRIKYNITTTSLPTKDEQIEILETQIDKLLKEKKDS